MIEFKNVTKVYENGTVALQDINLSIEQGEFVFVVGASGAGKSTFLKLIMKEENCTEGDIWVNNFHLPSMKRKAVPKFRRTMGVVFQDFRLIPKMTVFDNIAFAMRVIGASEKEIRKKVPHALELVALSHKARAYPNELSGGQQQRVALARALVNKPKLIVADEPTGNVDPEMSFEIVDLLNRISQQGTTVVMVTHEHSLVDKFNHRKVVIENGRLVKDTKIGFDVTQDAKYGFDKPIADYGTYQKMVDSGKPAKPKAPKKAKGTAKKAVRTKPNDNVINTIKDNLPESSKVNSIIDEVLGTNSSLNTVVRDSADIDYSKYLDRMEPEKDASEDKEEKAKVIKVRRSDENED